MSLVLTVRKLTSGDLSLDRRWEIILKEFPDNVWRGDVPSECWGEVACCKIVSLECCGEVPFDFCKIISLECWDEVPFECCKISLECCGEVPFDFCSSSTECWGEVPFECWEEVSTESREGDTFDGRFTCLSSSPEEHAPLLVGEVTELDDEEEEFVTFSKEGVLDNARLNLGRFDGSVLHITSESSPCLGLDAFCLPFPMVEGPPLDTLLLFHFISLWWSSRWRNIAIKFEQSLWQSGIFRQYAQISREGCLIKWLLRICTWSSVRFWRSFWILLIIRRMPRQSLFKWASMPPTDPGFIVPYRQCLQRWSDPENDKDNWYRQCLQRWSDPENDKDNWKKLKKAKLI